MHPDSEARFKAILATVNHGVLSTASSSGKPEAAVMVFAEAPAAGLFFYTFNDSRKFANLQENPRAALTLFEEPDYLQLDGLVHALREEDAIAQARRALLQKDGGHDQYQSDPRCRYFLFTPKRICLRRSADYPAQYEIWEI